MNTPKRLAWKRFGGEPFPDNAKLVDRSGCYGNPYKVAKYGLVLALELHRRWLRGDPEAVALAVADGWRWPDLNGQALVDLIRTNLVDLDLVCTGCGPDQPCHADTLLRVAADGEA